MPSPSSSSPRRLPFWRNSNTLNTGSSVACSRLQNRQVWNVSLASEFFWRITSLKKWLSLKKNKNCFKNPACPAVYVLTPVTFHIWSLPLLAGSCNYYMARHKETIYHGILYFGQDEGKSDNFVMQYKYTPGRVLAWDLKGLLLEHTTRGW